MPVEGQRWTATADESVAAAILALRDDEAFLARFRSKIDTRSAGDDECDIWTGAMSSEGYGVIRLGGAGAMRSEALRARDVWERENARAAA